MNDKCPPGTGVSDKGNGVVVVQDREYEVLMEWVYTGGCKGE